jgi:hypothetical protein
MRNIDFETYGERGLSLSVCLFWATDGHCPKARGTILPGMPMKAEGKFPDMVQIQ